MNDPTTLHTPAAPFEKSLAVKLHPGQSADTTIRDEDLGFDLLKAWIENGVWANLKRKPKDGRPAPKTGGPMVGHSLAPLLLSNVKATKTGYLVVEVESNVELAKASGLSLGSINEAVWQLRDAGVLTNSDLRGGRHYRLHFEPFSEAPGTTDKDQQLDLIDVGSDNADINDSATALLASEGAESHSAAALAPGRCEDVGSATALAPRRCEETGNVSITAPRRCEHPPQRRGASAVALCSGSGHLIQSFDSNHHQLGEEVDDDLTPGFQGTQADGGLRETGLAVLETKLRDQFTGWIERLDDESSDAMIERCLIDLGVGHYRAKHQARWVELTGSVLAELVERFAQYVGRVTNHGAYLASMVEDARAAIRAQVSADRAERLQGRAAEAAGLQSRIDSLGDQGFVELAVRCKVWPAVDHPTHNGKALRGFRTVYVEVAQKVMKSPELLDGLEVADV